MKYRIYLIFFLFIERVKIVIIKGNKISLRPVELSDDVLLQSLFNEPTVSQHVVGWSFPVSLHSQKKWIENQESNSSSNFRFVIVDNESGKGIGITGLWEIDLHNGSATSGIKILADYTKSGLGTETIKLVTAWSFYSVGLRRLVAPILDFNGPSLGLYMKKCGWRLEGRQREAIFRKGEWHDLYSVAILKREFDAQPDAIEFINVVCPVDTTPNIDINFQDYI